MNEKKQQGEWPLRLGDVKRRKIYRSELLYAQVHFDLSMRLVILRTNLGVYYYNNLQELEKDLRKVKKIKHLTRFNDLNETYIDVSHVKQVIQYEMSVVCILDINAWNNALILFHKDKFCKVDIELFNKG